jgi:hypothetical protein
MAEVETHQKHVVGKVLRMAFDLWNFLDDTLTEIIDYNGFREGCANGGPDSAEWSAATDAQIRTLIWLYLDNGYLAFEIEDHVGEPDGADFMTITVCPGPAYHSGPSGGLLNTIFDSFNDPDLN